VADVNPGDKLEGLAVNWRCITSGAFVPISAATADKVFSSGQLPVIVEVLDYVSVHASCALLLRSDFASVNVVRD